MSDIAKCAGNGCRQKYLCYRYTAPENENWQSWCSFYLDMNKEGSDCGNFLPIQKAEAA